jgi:hypothetical protein
VTLVVAGGVGGAVGVASVAVAASDAANTANGRNTQRTTPIPTPTTTTTTTTSNKSNGSAAPLSPRLLSSTTHHHHQGRQVLSLTRDLQAAAAERAALAREVERLLAALRSERRALAQADAKQKDLEELHRCMQARRCEQAKVHAEQTERLIVLAALQEGELALLGEQQAAAERWRSKLEVEAAEVRAALEAKQVACVKLMLERVELLRQAEEARAAEDKERDARAQAAEAAERDGLAAAAALKEAEEARAAACAAAKEREVAVAVLKLGTQEVQKQQRVLAEAEKQAVTVVSALDKTEAQVDVTSRTNARTAAKLAQAQAQLAAKLRAMEAKHSEFASFCNSRRHAFEARRALLRKEAEQARAQLGRAFATFAQEQTQAGALFAAAEKRHADLNAWTVVLRREMERRSDELEQLRHLEVERWEGYARRHAQARATWAELGRSRVALHRALSADRAAISHESTRMVSLRLARRREMRRWMQLNSEAEGCALVAVREARRRKLAEQQASATQGVVEAERTAANALELRVALLRRETAKAVGLRGTMEARAEKGRERLRKERAAMAEASRRAARVAYERRMAAQQAREAVEDKRRAEEGLAAEKLELERVGRATAGVETAKAQTAARVRAALQALEGARREHEAAVTEAQAQEWALSEARGVLEAVRERGMNAAARAAGVVAQVVVVGGERGFAA